ncbi:MAG TPA: hypothetical protein DCG75_10975, partial [Bacteroidales bacterium]|nr:hypothetical protein [Bacteroidales bacterium]
MVTNVKTFSEAPLKVREQVGRFTSNSRLKQVLIIIALLLVLSGQKIFAQGVGISETTIVPEASAILELKHTAGTFKGFLTPRMTEADRNTIAAPATGLIIYNTTSNKLNIFDGTVWRVLFSGDVGINDVFGTIDRITIDKTDAANPIINIATTYGGQTSIDTLGTITTGTWEADIVEVPYGGTGLSSITTNNLLYGNGTNAISLLAPSGITGEILMNTAAGAPGWSLLSNIPNTGLAINSGVYTNGTSGLTTTPPSTGTLGYWNRVLTTLSPSNVGDEITTSGDIYTTGTGTMTSAGLLTAQNGLNVTNTLQADDNVI